MWQLLVQHTTSSKSPYVLTPSTHRHKHPVHPLESEFFIGRVTYRAVHDDLPLPTDYSAARWIKAATATCIIIAPKRLKLRLSGSARKSQKWFRDTPRFKFQAVLARTQPFLSRNAEKRGDQSRFKCRKWSIIMQFAATACSRRLSFRSAQDPGRLGVPLFVQ